MKLTSPSIILLSLILLRMPLAANAQRAVNLPAFGYAAIIMDVAYEGDDYSVNIAQVLNEKYQLKLTGASRKPVFEWVAVDSLPLGLTIDSTTGQIFGTLIKSRPQPYLFRLHVFDKSIPNPMPLKLQVSLKVEHGPRPGQAPTLEPINLTTVVSGNVEKDIKSDKEDGNGASINGEKNTEQVITSSSNDVDIHAIEPKENATVAMTIKNPLIRQLEVVVKNKNGKMIDTVRTSENLPRGEARAFVKVKLEEGANSLNVRNADTGEIYSTIPVALNQTKSPSSEIPQPAKSSGVEVVHSGFVTGDAQVTSIKIKVEDQSINFIKIRLQSKKGTAQPIDLPEQQQPKLLKLKRGQNDYEQIIPLVSDPESETFVTIVATNDEGKALPEKSPLTLSIKRTERAKPITVKYSGLINQEAASVPLQITVNDPKISRLKIIVTPDDPKVDKPQQDKVSYGEILQLRRGQDSFLKMVAIPSVNNIKVWFYDVSYMTDDAVNQDKGETIPLNIDPLDWLPIERRFGGSPISTIDSNSLNTRAIIGFEQAGGSSADSQSKPFLDFFFTAPLRFKPKADELPRVSAWGQVRLASVPQQISTFGVLPANFVNPLAEGRLTELVQGFDFMAGLEVRVFGTDKPYVSLIPGIKNQTFMNFVAGGGAISPLSSRDDRSSTNIFTVPGVENPQRQLFIDRYGNDAAGKKYIAFVFPDRDRFLRQFYAGARFKTFYYGNDGTLINRFPAIFDIMIGQNEAVTGGRLLSDVTDDKGQIIEQKRRYVLRLEAFYPFPIKEANFLYLYGTAMMKVGGGGVKINTPLFLTTAPGEVSLTNNDVFIAPTLQSNRDYYRFGVGVNLTELFNRRPTTDQR